MPDPTVVRLHEWLKAHESELLADFVAMLKIPSLEGEPAPNAPFGPEPRRALDLALDLSKKAGLKTKDMDGFVAYAEMGQGERLVVSLGHLDVVPVGPGWKHEPFGAEIDEGYIYARGATDDKGATMASFYAIRALKECVPDLPARVRQVFGCNEESGFACVHHYVRHEEMPTFGVAPDASWPLIHGEKGIAKATVSVPLHKGSVELLEVTGGQRVNIVVDSCQGKLKVNPEARKHVEAKLADQWDSNVTAQWNGDILEVHSKGKAAHGSTPFLGDSAITRLFRFFFEIAPLEAEKYFEELLEATQVAGQGLGVHGNDEPSKELTSNAGIVSTEGGRLHISYSLRCPVTWKGEDVKSRIEKYLPTLKSGWRLEHFDWSDGLYFPLDHPLVKTIIEVAREELGVEEPPHVMGGGTYARAIPNTVAIGAGFDGDGKAHETDERIAIESLHKLSRAYATLFYRLATL